MSSHSAFPIDLVYLWVDGTDPKWIAKKDAAMAALGRQVDSGGAAPHRFEMQDELKFALRSAQKYLPWINHIYIITNEQTPAWLNAGHPRVSIVDHRDMIPAEYLPTFNSATLQIFLHRIPGLSEHFILSSDDMFAASPLTPDFFFNDSGDPIVILGERMYPDILFSNDHTKFSEYLLARQESRSQYVFDSIVGNAIRLVFELTGRRYHLSFRHALEPMRKSYLEDIFAKHGDKIILRTVTPFRDPSNIQRIFYSLYNHAHARTDLVAVWRWGKERVRLSAESSRFGIYWRGFLRKLPCVHRDYFDVRRDVVQDVYETISRVRPALFNINRSKKFAECIDGMEKLFPEKPEFEK